ncbi:MAG TPA: hypothetical protein VMC82_03095 [Thermoplasmata archaeon]|nr:hypothetical protein [Thermoplasmata archaeon]
MVELDLPSVAIITAYSTWALAVGTLIILFWQTFQAQVLNSANAVMNLRDKFDSTRMRAVRRHLADRLLKQAHEDITSIEVVTFFELVGTLTHRRVLDEELVWEAFGTWITAYWWMLRHPLDFVGKLRHDLQDPLIFHEYEWLVRRTLELDRRALARYGGASGSPEEEATRILKREALLESI